VIALGYKKEPITRYFRTPARSDYFELDGEDVTRFREKPVDGDGLINRAFFILEPGVLEHMEADTTSWKRGPWNGWPPISSSQSIVTPRSGNEWIRSGISSCSRNSGPRARLPGKHGSKRMRILVTGHHGYIGSILVELLSAAGHEVVGMDSQLYDECTFGEDIPSGISSIHRDVRELSCSDLEGIDAIAHLAGVCNDPLGDLLPQTTFDINHTATVRLADLAKASGIHRFVFSSSCSVYGAAGQEWIDERSEVNPITPYAASKWNAECDLRRLAGSHFSPVFLRSATAYGFSPRIRFDLVLNNLTAHAFTSGKVLLKSDGMPWRPIVHIEDISRAFLAAIEAPIDVVHNEVFNVGITTENYRIREIAQIVEETVPGSCVEYAAGAGPDTRTYRVDCSKISHLLPNFKPQWTAHRGARELYEKYCQYGLLLEDFEGARYQRLAYLQSLIARGAIDGDLRWIVPISRAETSTAQSIRIG